MKNSKKRMNFEYPDYWNEDFKKFREKMNFKSNSEVLRFSFNFTKANFLSNVESEKKVRMCRKTYKPL